MARCLRHRAVRVLLTGVLAAAVSLLTVVTPARAEQAPSPATPPPAPAPPVEPTPQTPQSTPPAQPDPTTPAAPPPSTQQLPVSEPGGPPAGDPNRIFGVIPNYTTVENTVIKVPPITSAQSFKMAALDSFDPFVYPLFAFVAGVAQLQNDPPEWGKGWPGYGRRYAAAFADNTVCSLITTGFMPSLLKQDPRYYQGRKSGFLPRLAYAASRSLVTKGRNGEAQFNLSEVGGTLVVANISNLYYPPGERNAPDTLQRWGTQAMWDTVANELKEFWPDIRRMLHGL